MQKPCKMYLYPVKILTFYIIINYDDAMKLQKITICLRNSSDEYMTVPDPTATFQFVFTIVKYVNK